MAEISYEDALAGNTKEVSYEDALSTTVKAPKAPMRGSELSYEQAVEHGNATFGGAVSASFTEGFKQGVGGQMEAAGDVLAPKEISYEDAFKASQANGPDVLGAITSAADTTRKKITTALFPEGGEVNTFGKDLAGAGADLGDASRTALKVATPDDLNIGQEAGVAIINSVGQTLPWVAAHRFGGTGRGFTQAGVLGQFGSGQFGAAYNEAKAHGATPDVAMQAALVSGGAEVAGEVMGLNTLLKAGRGWFPKFLAQEIGGEEFTTVIQSLTEKGLYNQEKWSSAGEIGHDILLTGMAAAGGAGVMGAASKGMDRLTKAENEVNFGLVEAQKELERNLTRTLQGFDVETALPDTPVTPADRAMAALLREQMANGLDVAAAPQGALFASRVNAAIGVLQEAGMTVPGEEAPVLQDEAGVSDFVLRGRQARYDPSALAPSARPFTFVGTGANEGILGLSIDQIGELPAGFVGAIGGRAENFPASVFQPAINLVQDFVQKYMPEARVVLNLEQFTEKDNTFGNHRVVVDSKGGIAHFITPMDMTNIGKHGLSDQKTSMAFMTSLSHEIGHAVTAQSFFQGIGKGLDAGLLAQFREQIAAGEVTPDLLSAVAQVAPEEAALAQTWSELRGRIMRGELTAVEFMDQWVGVRKLGNSISKTHGRSLYSWAEERLGKRIEGVSALELIEKIKHSEDGVGEYLSFDEYMAEQFSRASYASGELERSKLGQFFANTLERLRGLFRDLKSYKGPNGERMVQPGETFQTWLEKQTKRAGEGKKYSGKVKLSAKVKAAQKRITDAELGKILEEPVAPPEQVEPPADVTLGRASSIESLTTTMESLLETGVLEEGKVSHVKLRGMIKRGDFLGAEALIEKLLVENSNWDREYTSKVLERLPNKEKVREDTLRATLKQQDIKLAERRFWEGFAVNHPEGFTRTELLQALKDEVLPLETSRSFAHAQVGLRALGLDKFQAQSIIWQSPLETAGSSHFPQHSGYLMHSRRLDLYDMRLVLELQSDVFQQKGAELPMQEGYTQLAEDQFYALQEGWWQRLIREEAAAAFKDAKTELLFPTAETVKLIEGWDTVHTLPEFVGYKYVDYAGRIHTLTGEFDLGADRVSGLAKAEGTQRYVGLEEDDSADAARILEILRKDKGDLGEHQGIYDRYNGPIARFLKTEMKATPVEYQGNTWLKVDPTVHGEKVFNWDRENPIQPTAMPETTLVNFAGMEPADYRNHAVVAEAAGMWSRLKFESPYFKRWFGASQVLGDDGKPLGLWRGVGNRVSYLDPTTRGGLTGAVSARKAFWLSDNHAQAAFYMDKAKMKPRRVLEDAPNRKAQGLRQKLEDLRDLAQELVATADPRLKLVQAKLRSVQTQIDGLHNTEGNTRDAQPAVQEFYVRMENPLVKDGNYQPYDDKIYTAWLGEALANGHDGVIIKNTHDPLGSTVYAIFEPEQAKLTDNIGTFDPTDELHWDRDSPTQVATRSLSKILQTVWDKAGLKANNVRAKAVDTFIQLQQAAAAQPDAYLLNSFLALTRSAEVMKNNLQYDAEETSKRMASMVHSSKQAVKDLGKILDAEWRGGSLQSMLVGKDAMGAVVWGADVGTGLEQRQQVRNWEVQDTLGLRKFMLTHGVDVTTERGKQVLDLYLRVRNVFLKQFKGLEITLRDKAAGKYENAPSVLKTELWKIEELMTQLRTNPFVPQGNFGNYVVIVQKDQGVRQENGRRFVTIRKTHYENKEDFQIALKEAFRKTKGDSTLKVKSRVLEEQNGIPMQLPSNLLEKLGETGVFEDSQLELMADMMLSPKYDKIADRFLGAPKIEGANQDFGKVFAAFTWHNSNYIWKMYYRAAFNSTIAQQRTEIRRTDGRQDLTPEQAVQVLERARRNLALMEKSADYMLHPPAEFQQARLMITMAYLAFNPLTAVMNFSTQLNTWAAVTSEYGELNGNRMYARGLKEVAQYFMLDSRIAKEKNPKELARLNELKNLYDTAIRAGVIDQSYAYFLAGQANTSGGLMATSNDAIGRTAHAAMETGMLLFRSVEKANRLTSLVTFYEAERGAGSSIEQAYATAVQKTDLLQNSFSAANKPEFARGKKAILFMFSSFAQHMAWITAGGYERASGRQAALAGRRNAAAWHGTTAKLWVLYMLLGGLGGAPFAETVFNFVKFVWRKVFGQTGNPELELRKFVKDVGGDPEVVMHGLFHNVGGFDLSGKFGLGRLIPGSDLLNRTPKNAEELLGRSVLAFAGPAGGIYNDMFKAVAAGLSGKPKEVGKAFPGEIGALARAFDAAVAQEATPTAGVTAKDGTRMTWDKETGEFRDITTKELMGMAIGATPTIVSENRQKAFFESSESLYWNTRRSDLLDKYKTSVRTNDEAARELVRDQIQAWNDSDLPDTGLRIKGQDMSRAVNAQRKHIQASERFGTAMKRDRGVVKPIQEIYE